jgi:ATP-dependent RNA helicase DeaD
MEEFRALGLSEATLSALEKKGFITPSPIQKQTIPLLLNGTNDIIGQAQTGTGKTAAFGLPILEKFDPNIRNVQALILTPTRELALQVTEEIKSYKGDRKIWITTVYGGAAISSQMRELEKGTHIVVGTPGRVIDLIERKKLILSEVKYVVLDEADEMLNMGFLDDVELILNHCNKERRMLLFSATMPDRILSLARRYMGKYDLVAVKNKELTMESISQSYYEVPSRDRFDALCRILDVEEDFYGIIFCNTKAEVIEICNHLNDKGYYSDALHGDIAQNLREKVVRQFKSNKYGVLVATDVAARGIDIQDLTHVINYGLPQDPESYVHRIGRTGRAGKTGKAICIIDRNEHRKLLFIQKITRAIMKKLKLPDAQDMVRIKKQRVKDQIETIITTEHYSEYIDFAKELLGDNEPQVALAAILKHFVKDELNVNSYKIIKDSEDRDRGGRDRNDRDSRGGNDRGDNRRGGGKVVRLFFAKGRKDNLSPRQILDILRKDADVDSRKIDDIRIMDNFSFFTTNGELADIILDVYKRKAKKDGEKPLVDKAKDRN